MKLRRSLKDPRGESILFRRRALAGFVLFRIFDVIKPFPAGRFERLHGGLGVMSDDAMAAVYANLSLRLTVYLFPTLFA